MRERSDFSETDGELLSVSEYSGVQPRKATSGSENRLSRLEGLDGYRRVKRDDLVMNYMLAWKGAHGVSNYEGIVSPAYAVFEIDQEKAFPRFMHHYLRSSATNAMFRSASRGIIDSRLRLYPDVFLSQSIELPDMPAQKAIADFLDREVARIDQLVKKKERMIALVREDLAAVISIAVTLGFDSSDSLKRTSSIYLPEIPESWSLQRLKQIATVRGGLTVGRAVPPGASTVSTSYLRVANVQAGWLELDDIATIEATTQERQRYALRANDVLMNEGGDNDKLGRGAVWSTQVDPCLHQNHVFAVRPHDPDLAQWIALASNSRYGRDFFFLNSKQSTNLASISKSRLEQFPIALPQPSERIRILNTLESRLIPSNALIGAIGKSTRILRELRAALITAAVTGQIDVATWGKRGETDRRLETIERDLEAEQEAAS